MRVAWLLSRFPVASETFFVTQLQGLERAGHEVDVVARARPRQEEPENDAVRRSSLLLRTGYLTVQLAPDALEPQPAVPLAPGRHDVLHAHFGPNCRRFLFARAQARAPLVASFHGYDFSAQPREHGASMYDVLFEVADLVTYNCEHARQALERLGCPPAKLRRARVGVDLETLAFCVREHPADAPVRLLTVGRLVEKKGHEIVLRALAAARERLPSVVYDIVGDGPLAGGLRALASDLGLDGVVRFHGARSDADVRRFLARAHVFALASTTASDGDEEGSPVVLMEAQACGIPVVSTRHSGIPEVVLDGRSGVLVPAGDVAAFASALVDVLDRHADWARLGRAGRAHVESTFDVSLCTRELVSLYEDARAAYSNGPTPAPRPRMTRA